MFILLYVIKTLTSMPDCVGGETACVYVCMCIVRVCVCGLCGVWYKCMCVCVYVLENIL